MKTIENVTIYKCDFCKKELKRKWSMELHEKLCNNNPVNHKKCLNCVHLNSEEMDVEFLQGYDYHDGEPDYRTQSVKVLKCDKLDKLMFPWAIEKKELHLKHPITFEDQEPMPKECDSFSDNYDDVLGHIFF